MPLPLARNKQFFKSATLTSLLTAWAAFSPSAAAIDPNRALTQTLHRIWHVQQGLPQATVHCVRRLANGYLLLGTNSGLYRFDGIRFSPLPTEEGVDLGELFVRSFLEDGNGTLWIAADGTGLVQLRNGIASLAKEGFPAADVNTLTTGADGEVWAATKSGAAHREANGWKIVSRRDGLPWDDVRAVAAADGVVWFGGPDNRIVLFSSGRFEVRTLKSIPPNAETRAMLGSSDGCLWVGTSTGLVRIRGVEERVFRAGHGLAHDEVLSLWDGGADGIWVGTQGGFSRIRGEEVDSYRSRDGLSQTTAFSVCEDREGALWVGTKCGLNQFIDRRTLPFTTDEGLPSNEVGPVTQDSTGVMWIGTQNAGLCRFDGRKFNAIGETHGLAGKEVHTLESGPDGRVWAGGDHGVSLIRGGRVEKVFSTKDGLPSDDVISLFRDRKGELWAGTRRGLSVFDGGRFRSLGGGPVFALDEFRGEIVCSTPDGVFRVDRKSRTLQPLPGAPTKVDCVALFSDSDDALWIGVKGAGVRMFDGSKCTSVTGRDGLYDDDVFGIVADGEDNLWMACSKGIFSVPRSMLRDFFEGRRKRVNCLPFSPTDALRTVESRSGVQPAAFRAKDGRIWFATIHGVIVLDPAKRTSVPKLPIVVEEVTVNGSIVDGTELASVGATNLSVRYTSLNLLSPLRTTFRYRLEGFDPDWIPAGQRREAFYTNLRPGDYVFRVTASALDDASGEAPPIHIHVAPHFWQTTWFVGVCLGTVAAGVFAAYRLRLRQIEQRLQAVVAERTRIARELHDTLMQGFAGVTMQMQALTASLPATDERKTLQDIVHDAGRCLREARNSIAGLRSPTGSSAGLDAALARAARQLTEGSGLQLHLKLQPCVGDVPAEVEFNLLRIGQEAVANAVRHASARNVELEMRCSAGRIRIRVADDGVGLPDGLPSRAGSFGVVGMRERAREIGASVEITSAGAGRGTTVAVSWPAEANASR